jgi:hypothetical protein
MIRPRLSKIASGTRLTADLINYIINRIEYAADLLRQYKLIAGTEMYVETHYDGTRVSYLKPVGGGAGPRPPPSIPDTIELQEGIVYSISADQVNVDGEITTFTLSPAAYARGILITGGTWIFYYIPQGKWIALLDTGYISGSDLLQFYGGFKPSNWGYSTFGQPYWTGGTIQIWPF